MHIPIISALMDYLRGDGRLILPEIELTLFGLGILLVDFTLGVKERHFNAGIALLGTIFSAYTVWRLRIPVALEDALPGFHDSIIVDHFFLFFAALFLSATGLVILLSVKFLDVEQQQEGEYYALLLFACVGMMFMASGTDLIVMFLGLETMALSFYVLTGFLRREKRSNEASLKYVLLGAFSSGILAYGFSLLYGLSGTTNIRNIAFALNPASRLADVVARSQEGSAAAREYLTQNYPAALHLDPYLLTHQLPVLAAAAFVLVAVGMFFKVAAAPFHQWAPDVYEGAPTPVTIFVSVASKTASFALLLRLFIFVFGYTQVNWMYLVAGIAVASLTWGNLAALTQTNVKRLLAYSSISHVGYVLLALVAWDDKTRALSETAKTGIAFYLFAYIFMTAGAFAILIVLRQKGLIGEELEDLNGLYQRSPAAAVLLLIFMLSLAGIPPTAGFMGKYFIFLSLIETHHPVLAVFAVLYIVPALYYYFRIVVHAWLKAPGEAPRPVMSNAQAVALGVAVFVTLAAGLYPEPFTRLAQYAFGR
jgi:NADH-quinone oxidoreductase subunit N